MPGVYFLALRFFSLCCVETTTLVQPTALPSTYCTVTWLFASGCRSNSLPARRCSESVRRILCAKKIGAGMYEPFSYTSLSVQAKPNIMP